VITVCCSMRLIFLHSVKLPVLEDLVGCFYPRIPTSRFVTLVYDLAVIAFTSQCFRLKSPNQETLTRISLISGGGLLVLTPEFRLAVEQ